MTSEAPAGRDPPRFPLGLTLAAAVALAILIGLGVWQLQRADWKTLQLARIDALRTGPPQPIAPVLARAAAGEDMTSTRVVVDCAPAAATPIQARMTTDNGEWITRARSLCGLAGPVYSGVTVDRGFVVASRGSTQPAALALPAPVHVVGILYRSPDLAAAPGAARLAPYTLVADRETPSPPGVTPAPYADAAENLRYVGAYAPTWFGLAGALACIYAAMLWRRHHPRT